MKIKHLFTFHALFAGKKHIKNERTPGGVKGEDRGVV
jgi:hypothetical protein